MAIPLTGSGGLFTRLGHLIGTLNTINTHVGTTAPSHVTTIAGDYTATDQSLVSGIWSSLTGYQSSASSLLSTLQSIAQNTVTQMAADDGYATSSNLGNALNYLINQMVGASQTVKSCAITSSVTPGGSNTGNGVLVVGTKLKDGRVAENSYVETLSCTITSDSQSSGATAGEETLSVAGQLAANSSLGYQWPLGSGATGSLVAVAASRYQSGGNSNWIRNGDFEQGWGTGATANTPNGWSIDVGTDGTSVVKSATHYDGSNSISFVGDASELTSIYQPFNTQSGSTVRMLPLNQLTFCGFVNVTGSPAAGVLEVALTDGSGAILLDGQGNSSSFTKSLTTISTWTAVTGTLRTPRVLPATVRLRIRLSTALSAGGTVFIDRLAMTQPTQFYLQGPHFALFSGNANFINGDTFSVSIGNDNLGGFQRGFDRLMDMKSKALLLPSAGSPTISEGLIT